VTQSNTSSNSGTNRSPAGEHSPQTHGASLACCFWPLCIRDEGSTVR
jgi:hypothetical protein